MTLVAASELTLSLGVALGLALSTAPEAGVVTAGPYDGPAVGAQALYAGSWVAPGGAWRDALSATGPTTPEGPVAAQEDKPDYYTVSGCHVGHIVTVVDPCVLGDPDGTDTWLVLGSSKTGTWVDPLGEIAAGEGVRLEVGTRSSTPWTPGFGSGDGRTYNDAGLDYVRQTAPEVLFLTWDQPADFAMGPQEYADVVTRALEAGAGQVVVLWNPGGAEPNPMTCLEGDPEDYRTCAFSFVEEELDEAAAVFAEDSPHVGYASVRDWIAPEGEGQMVIGGVITRGAGSHLTATYARSLERPLASELSELGLVELDPDAMPHERMDR